MNNITGVVSNQMIHPFKYEENEMVTISTGHKAKSADLVRARGIGMGRPRLQQQKQAVRKYPHKTGHICSKSLLVS